VEELISIRNEISENQSQFLDLENEISKTEKDLETSKKNLEKSAKSLSINRHKIIPVFTKKIEAIIKQLGLEKAKIEVDLKETEILSTFGKENIQILFQANSGFPLKPIQEAISGGERSRVMLSIKKIMAENSNLPSLILDEIDTGVSGKIAEEMGNVMQEMAKDLQLIVITHLAQVAAKGSNNYKVVKEDVSGKTQSNIISLNEAEKLQEIAQLLSGSKITEAAFLQAKELIG
jgi:DNA repair protein RecN (Recombination protein N)